MLQGHYDKVLVGHNYLSLAFALKALKAGANVLILDVPTMTFESNFNKYVSYLEMQTLKNIGHKFGIKPLQEVDKYLTMQDILIYLNNVNIQFGGSPFLNLKEISRKFSNEVGADFYSYLNTIDAQAFDQQIFELLDNHGLKSIEEKRALSYSFDSIDSKLKNFLDVFFKDQVKSRQISFILQAMFQNAFSPKIELERSDSLLTNLICPHYILDTKKLSDELVFEYRRMGGDFKRTSIEQWGIVDEELRSLLLSSVDGIVNLDELYLFSEVGQRDEFELKENSTRFMSVNLLYKPEHDYIDYLKGKRVIHSVHSMIGTDFPYLEYYFDERGVIHATFMYADANGTKPSYHFGYAQKIVFNSLNSFFPKIDIKEWHDQVMAHAGDDVWINCNTENKVGIASELSLKGSSKKIKYMHYCGPRRTQAHGLYSYLVDVFFL